MELAYWMKRERVESFLIFQLIQKNISGGDLTMLADSKSNFLDSKFTFKDEKSKLFFRQRCYSLLMFGNMQGRL